MILTRINNKYKKIMQGIIAIINPNPNSNNQDWSKEEAEKKPNLVPLMREHINIMTEESLSPYPQMN